MRRGIGAVLLLWVACGPGCSSGSIKAGSETSVLPAGDKYFATDMNSRFRPVIGTKGMVVADDRIAAEWGARVLRRGGNAVDAAVATAFALSVTRPHFAALGGGGFMIYCPAPRRGKARKCHALDYREKAPKKSTRDMYVVDGKGRTDLSQNGSLAPGVPGVTAGLLYALKKWGSKGRAELLREPIRLARDGFRFTGYMETAAKARWDHLNEDAKKIVGCSRWKVPKDPCKPGETFRQPDLARVLEAIAEKGRDGFYDGFVASRIVRNLGEAGGIMSREDLRNYEPTLRKPVTGEFMGLEVNSMPPPSAGGTNVVQMLQLTEIADQKGRLKDGFGAASTIHAIVHAMSLAFADRAEVFGDPEFVTVPVKKLTSREYLLARWNDTFSGGSKSVPDGPGVRFGAESTETTHFSVIDSRGNAVAITTTVNGFFGSGFVPRGTGVFMNNEMDDFSIQPGVPNLFGLVGAEANAVAPGKRPLSSMSPTIVRNKKGEALLALGAAGGPRITTSVFQTIVNRFRFGMALPDAVAAPRYHHQWKPDRLYLERNGFPPEVKGDLAGMGYEIHERTASGRIHALERFPDTGRVWGVPDHRAEGAAVAE